MHVMSFFFLGKKMKIVKILDSAIFTQHDPVKLMYCIILNTNYVIQS